MATHPIDRIKDGGFKSRKMLMAYVVMFLGSAAWFATAFWPGLAVNFNQYCMFLLGAAGLFVTGNVAVKWVGTGKAIDPNSVPSAMVAQDPISK